MEFYTELEASEKVGKVPETLRRWRDKGKGPPFIKRGGSFLYPVHPFWVWHEEGDK